MQKQEGFPSIFFFFPSIALNFALYNVFLFLDGRNTMFFLSTVRVIGQQAGKPGISKKTGKPRTRIRLNLEKLHLPILEGSR